MSFRDVSRRFEDLDREIFQITAAVNALDDWTIGSRQSVDTLIDAIQDRLKEFHEVLEQVHRELAVEIKLMEAGDHEKGPE